MSGPVGEDGWGDSADLGVAAPPEVVRDPHTIAPAAPHGPDLDSVRDEAEVAVLGSVFAEPARAGEALRMLSPADFEYREHNRIFAAIGRLCASGAEPEPIAVRNELRARGELEKVGGSEYLAVIVEIVPTSANLPYWCREIRNRSIRRRAAALLASGDDLETVRATLDERVDAPVDLFQPYTSEHARADALLAGEAISTGIASLDAAEFMLHAGNVWTFAGRQGGGKTAVLLETTMRHVESTSDACALFISFEGSRSELYRRLLLRQVAAGRVEDDRPPGAPYLADATRWLRDGHVFEHEARFDSLATEWEAELEHAAQVLDGHLRAHRLVLIDGDDVPGEGGVTASRIMDALRLSPRRPTLAVFDYWQKLTPTNRGDVRYVQLKETADRLRRYAKGDGDPAQAVVVLTAAQINREADGQPRLEHIRESDDLGNDGAGVVTLYLPDDPDPVKRMKLQVVKNRFGPNGGRAELLFHGSCGYFAETDTEAEQKARTTKTTSRIRADVERIYAEDPTARMRDVRAAVRGKGVLVDRAYREVFGDGRDD